MTSAPNRFDDFFQDATYAAFKNSLYSYILRKRAIENQLRSERGLMLEVGSGISPIITAQERIVYSDISLNAMRLLRHNRPNARVVVADAQRLPFKSGSFSAVISSEVLEHVQDDVLAVQELARVMHNSGRMIITVPHGKFYFSNDDRFVKHLRRYDLVDLEILFASSGMIAVRTQKVLGPLDKMTMSILVACFPLIEKLGRRIKPKRGNVSWVRMAEPFFRYANRFFIPIAWLDVTLWPRKWASVLLMEGKKREA